MGYDEFYITMYKTGRFDKVEVLDGKLVGRFWVGVEDRIQFPSLKSANATEIQVTVENKIYKVQVI